MAEYGKKVKLRRDDCKDSEDHIWIVGDGCHEKKKTVKPTKPPKAEKNPKTPSQVEPEPTQVEVQPEPTQVEVVGRVFELPPQSATKKVLFELLLKYQDSIPEIKGKGQSTVNKLTKDEMYKLVKALHKSLTKPSKTPTPKKPAVEEPVPVFEPEVAPKVAPVVISPVKPPVKVTTYLENLNIPVRGKSINEICTTVVDLAEQKDQEISDLQFQLSEKEMQLQKALQELEELKKKVLDEVSEEIATETCYTKDKHNSIKELNDDLECKTGVCDIVKQQCVVTKKTTTIDMGCTQKQIAADGARKVLRQIDELIKEEKNLQSNTPLEDVENAGGGNCFFHALAQIVNETFDKDAGNEFRKEVAEWMRGVKTVDSWFMNFYEDFMNEAQVYAELEDDSEDVLKEQYGNKGEPLRKFVVDPSKTPEKFKTALIDTLNNPKIWATNTIVVLTVKYYLDLNMVILFKNNLGIDCFQAISWEPNNNLNIVIMRWHKEMGQGLHFEAVKSKFSDTPELFSCKQFENYNEYVYRWPEALKMDCKSLKSCFTKTDYKSMAELRDDLKCPSGTVCHLDQSQCVPESSVSVVSKITIDGVDIKVTGQNKVKVVEQIKRKILASVGAGVEIEPLPFKPVEKPVMYQPEKQVWATLEDELLPTINPAYVPEKRTTEPIDLDKLRASLLKSVIKVKTAVQEKAEKVDAKIRDEISRCFMENLKR